MFDFSDHTLTQIGTWTEVAILLFMLWEYYEPRIRAKAMTAATYHKSSGIWGRSWDNRTLIVGIVGLVIVGWLHFGIYQRGEAQKATLIEWLQRAQGERNRARGQLASRPAEAPPDLVALIASLRSQIETANRSLEEAKQERDIARHPPSSPDKRATWLELQFDAEGKPTEKASANIRWAWWDPPIQSSDTIFLPSPDLLKPSYPTTTLIFLAFEHPIKYDFIYLKSKDSVAWRSFQQSDRVVVIWIESQMINDDLSIEIIK